MASFGAVQVRGKVTEWGDRVRGWLRRAEVDRAVGFGLCASVLQWIFAPVTMLLIARHFTAEMQGFYYTFGSLLALQSLAELGLSVVVLNAASHEWAHLGLSHQGQIVGEHDRVSRLVSLGRFVFRWYAVASAVFIAGVGTAGQIFLSRSARPGIVWVGPWWALVTLSGLVLWALPFHSLLEGCNQVATIQRFRASQLALRSGALWLTLILGGGLWAPAVVAGVSVLRNAYLLGVQYRRFFRPFLLPPAGQRMNWKTDLWPMQWRLGLSGTVSFLLSQAFTPVLFYYRGAAVAGQMGMTQSAVSAVQSIALQWLPPKVPQFGMLIARKDYAGLDRLWLRTTRVILAIAAAGAASAWLLICGLNALHAPFAARLLPPMPAGLFLLASIFIVAGYCQTAYLRAHKREPLLPLSITISVLMGFLVWIFGSRYGAMGAAVANLIVIGGVGLPWETLIWIRARKTWHKPSPVFENA